MEKRSQIVPKRCISARVGLDGTKRCSPEPHLHKVWLPARLSTFGRSEEFLSCDNHKQSYLEKGWLDVTPRDSAKALITGTARKLCTNCTTNAATVGDICEHCLDTMPATDPNGIARLINSGYCLNRDLIPGCNQYALTSSQYCEFCTRQGFNSMEFSCKKEPAVGKRTPLSLRPRVKTVSTSTRPCKITPGCAGSMTATVRMFSPDIKPELVWNCEICRQPMVAKRSRAIVDPEAPIVEPINADMADLMDATSHIREMLSED